MEEFSIPVSSKLIYFLLVVLFGLLIIPLILIPASDILRLLVRLGALWGITCLFLASLINVDKRSVKQYFGQHFLSTHHLFSVFGLLLITLHPVSFAILQMNPAIFIPRFDSWIIFWELAGRPALILIYIAVIAGLLRRKLSGWKHLHRLNYIALVFGVVHGFLIGTDFQLLGVQLFFIGMSIALVIVVTKQHFLK